MAVYGYVRVSTANQAVAWSARGGDETRQGFGRNGAWGEAKNRTTSAACYVRNNEPPVLVHNYWARMRLPEGLSGGVEYRMRGDSTFARTG